MASYNTPIITTQGQSLLKATIANNDTMTFTKIVFSSDDYSQSTDSNVASLTALSSLDLTATARAFVDVNGNLKIRGVATNQNTTSAFYIKTYGLYVKNSSGTEMLFAVATTQNANFVPAYNNKQTNQVAYTFNLAISSTSNITLSNQSDVDVTQADIASINNAVNSNASSLSSSMSSVSNSLSSSIANNSSAITALSNASITYQGKISSFNQGNKQGLYKYFDGTTSSTLTVIQYNDVLIQTRIDTWDANGATFADDDYAPKMRLSADGGNTWSAWSELATQYDVQSINSTATSLANSLATQTSNMSTNISNNSSAISSNATNIASNASAISSNATSTSSAISSVSSSNNAVSSSIASTVSVNQSNIANNSSAINSLVSSASSAIANNAQAINQNTSNIQTVQTSLNNLTGSTIQYRGLWKGAMWDWGNHADGIYIIDVNQNSNGWAFFNGAANNFSGWGIFTLTSTGGDKYGVIHDNGNHMFRNHLYVGSATFSGWVQY